MYTFHYTSKQTFVKPGNPLKSTL